MATNLNRTGSRRFLFSCAGAYGHFHPMMPLAQALKEAGHEIAFVTNKSRQATVEAAGFTFCPVGGGEMSADPEYQQVKASLREMPLDLESELYAYPRLFCGINARLKTPDMVEIARQWQPDMLIREGGSYSAAVAAEYLGLPHATIAFAASLKGHAVFEREVPSQLDPTRQRWGLPPDPDLSALYRYLQLCYSPPTFSLKDIERPGAPRTVPPTTHFIRQEFFNQSGNEGLPDWMSELPPQPTVYVTLGTEVNSEPELYPRVMQTIIAGLREASVNLIVTLGKDKDPADFGPQPENVHIERYIPQSLLLPHCDLMVMHGGSNSLLEALDIGLPTVVVPLIADQFFNAEVMQSLQLAQVVPLGQLTPEGIQAAMDEVLANPLYRQNVKRLQAEMHALPGQKYAVELVEKVATERKPMLNPALTLNL